MGRIDNITVTNGRLKQAYDNGLGKLVKNDIIKTITKTVDKSAIRTGVVTKFYPYLDKAEVELNKDSKVICKRLHLFGGELTDYYTPSGDKSYCNILNEPCIIPKSSLECLVVNIHDNDSDEYLLLGFYEVDELIGISPAPEGNMKISSIGATNDYYVQFGANGLQICSKKTPMIHIGEMEDETVKLEYANREEVYTKKEIDNILNSGIHNIDFLANLDNIIQELINYGA